MTNAGVAAGVVTIVEVVALEVAVDGGSTSCGDSALVAVEPAVTGASAEVLRDELPGVHAPSARTATRSEHRHMPHVSAPKWRPCDEFLRISRVTPADGRICTHGPRVGRSNQFTTIGE